MKELFWWFVIIGVLISGSSLAILYVMPESNATSSDQKGMQYHIELNDGITFKDNIQTDQTIEGVKYKVSLSDGIGTRDHIR